MEKAETTDNYMHELAAMSKRFGDLYEIEEVGLCGIGTDSDGPYVQLSDRSFRKLFNQYDRNFSIHIKSPMLVAYLDGVKFIAIERSENVQV